MQPLPLRLLSEASKQRLHSQYRLCPAHKELDEECFQATPVPFASNASKLRWGGTAGDAKACEVRTPRNSRLGLLLAVG